MLNRASSTSSISSTPLPLKAAWKSFSACSSFIELNGGRPFWLPDMRVFGRFPRVRPWLYSVALLATNLGQTILDVLKGSHKMPEYNCIILYNTVYITLYNPEIPWAPARAAGRKLYGHFLDSGAREADDGNTRSSELDWLNGVEDCSQL